MHPLRVRIGLACWVLCGLAWFVAADAAEPPAADGTRSVPATELTVPAADLPMCVTVSLPESLHGKPGPCKLVEVEAPGAVVSGQLISERQDDGTAGKQARRLVANIPPRPDAKGQRRFRLESVGSAGDGGFRFEDADDKSLKFLDGDAPVMTYNHGVIIAQDLPEKDFRRGRGCYIHPLWGLNGEVLTDDFPKDHPHHHGIFWGWPYIGVGGKEYDMWVGRDIQPKFVRWLHRETGPVAAVLAVENGWFTADAKIMVERLWMTAYKAAGDTRAIDLDFTWIPVDKPVSLRGRAGKSYGGLTLRLNVWPRRDSLVTYPDGVAKFEGNSIASPTDLENKPLAWADITTEIPGAPGRSGAAVLIPPDHPNYPPSWLTRCYGPLCVGWPGVEAKTFEPGTPFHAGYRILVHKGQLGVEQLKAIYDAYVAGSKIEWR